ncbi:hypothetical protein POM88_020556 [Heracleum sosnowskyi]|uniref:Uncharacterized protein n=1 Tax=Heracleum sosnowskyi TaxID=360622 RepID=A0AAD8IC72_9APIA|nr:hypothetical protein POM88_020556 [Heracleum sosnowskyi]
MQMEKGVSASLRATLDQRGKEFKELAEELAKTTQLLERVEREAHITFEDCVGRYKGSEAYITELEIKAGEFHEEGYNDCLKFVGAGNALDPTVHFIEAFRDFEIARLEAEKAVGDRGEDGVQNEVGAEEREHEEKAREPEGSEGGPRGDPDPTKGSDEPLP